MDFCVAFSNTKTAFMKHIDFNRYNMVWKGWNLWNLNIFCGKFDIKQAIIVEFARRSCSPPVLHSRLGDVMSACAQSTFDYGTSVLFYCIRTARDVARLPLLCCYVVNVHAQNARCDRQLTSHNDSPAVAHISKQRTPRSKFACCLYCAAQYTV